MFVRPLLCGLLLATCLPALARETSAPDVLERTPCPSVGNASVAPDAGLHQRQAPPASASKARTGTGAGVDGGNAGRAPRWHSFLPGMFR